MDASISVFAVLPGTRVPGARLKVAIVAEVWSAGPSRYVAATWLDAAEAYGEGQNVDLALDDLLIALAEFRRSLERQGAQLDADGKAVLICLKRLVRPTSRRGLP